jgi:putative heme-binding domain-containing protein
LLATGSGALSVALAVIDGSLKGDLRAQAIAKGSALLDPLRRDLFERLLPDEQRREVVGVNVRPETILVQQGDAVRGKPLFTALCATCHRAGDAGTDFGPDLTRIAAKFDRAQLLEQILDPAKLIEPQWELATVSLKNGDAASGFVGTRTETDLTLKLAGGAKRTINQTELAKLTTDRVSMMPAGLLQGLTAKEAADLLEFVTSLK